MTHCKIASVQMNALIDDMDANIQTHLHYIQEAATQNVDVIMFPELSVTGHYGDDKVVQFGQPATSGSIYDTLSQAAQEHNIIVSYGLCESANGTYYNSQVLLGPSGLIGVQRKVHASKDEYFSFRMGAEFPVFDLGFCKIGTLICYDSWIFESWRELALGGAEIILLPHASRSGWNCERNETEQISDFKNADERISDNAAFARSNGVFGIFANQCGYNGHSTHWGTAHSVDPLGQCIAQSELTLGNQMLISELDTTALSTARQSPWHTIKTRRPHIYRRCHDTSM